MLDPTICGRSFHCFLGYLQSVYITIRRQSSRQRSLLQTIGPPSTTSKLRQNADQDDLSLNILSQLPDGYGLFTPFQLNTLIRQAADPHIPKASGYGGLERVPLWNTEVDQTITLNQQGNTYEAHLRAYEALMVYQIKWKYRSPYHLLATTLPTAHTTEHLYLFFKIIRILRYRGLTHPKDHLDYQ